MKSRKAKLLKDIGEKDSKVGDAILCSSFILPAASESNATNCRFIVEISHCEIVSTRTN